MFVARYSARAYSFGYALNQIWIIDIRSGNNIYLLHIDDDDGGDEDVNIDKIRFVRGQITVRTSYAESFDRNVFAFAAIKSDIDCSAIHHYVIEEAMRVSFIRNK